MAYTSGYNGNRNRLGALLHEPAKQEWAVGAIVSVGFMKGLTVIGKVSRKLAPTRIDNDSWLVVSAKGVHYLAEPHRGASKLGEFEVEEFKALVAKTASAQ